MWIKARTSKSTAVAAIAALTVALPIVMAGGAAHAFKLPKQITPALRAACEADVRRLCIRTGSTVSSVKSCVRRKFSRLNLNCKMRIVSAGLY